MTDSRKSARALEEAPVGGDVGAVQLNRKGEEGRIVKGQGELPPQAGGAPQQRCGGWGHDEGQGFQALDDVIKHGGAQPGLGLRRGS